MELDSIASSEDDSLVTPLHHQQTRDPDAGPPAESNGAEPSRREVPPSPKKSSCKSNCINGNLVALKALLFVFYGGIGVLSTWLNHSLLSRRFTEKETALVYGLSSLISIGTPFIFGIISDKTARPKRVLAVCLLLAGIVYPLVTLVPSAVSYHYKEKLDWCRATGRNETSCLPYKLNCTTFNSEIIMDYGVCSEGCGGKLIITKCQYKCDDVRASASTGRRNDSLNPAIQRIPSEGDDNDYDVGGSRIVASAQIASDPELDYPSYGLPDVDPGSGPPPHVCMNADPREKYRPLCHVYSKDKLTQEINLSVADISGYTEIEGDGKCHYPLNAPSDNKEELKSLLSCSPLPGPYCHVSCELRWDKSEVDQWVCRDDYLNWMVSFSLFLIIHALGTMFVISAAGLLNSAVLSMAHEHEHGSYFGFQMIFGTLGFAILTPLTAFLFETIQSSDWEPLPWSLEYVVAFSIWLILAAMLTCTLTYHAEWVPKPATIRPMLKRWSLRGQTALFFTLLIVLGCFQGMVDVLGYYQIKSVGGSLLVVGFGAVATVAPAIIFIYRVERVIDYCGHHNILCIALVVVALQFTGYAYLQDAAAEWSFLLKAMDTFSIVMVWVTASFTTHNSAPRSLVATCQAVIVILYCCIGRGIGGVFAYAGLIFMSKENLLKTCAIVAIIFCILFLVIHYWCLKPIPTGKKYNVEKLASQAPSGKYKPVKLIGQKGISEDEKDDEL